MTSDLVIPTVTQDELRAFQVRIFGESAITTEKRSTSSTLHHDEEQKEDFLEDEDGLGYYPDGVKRTLTDEQIAMFRHSEIYAIVRQRQLLKENKDAGPDYEAVSSFSEGQGMREVEEQAAVLVDGALNSTEVTLPLASVIEELAQSDDEREYERFLEAEKEVMQIDAARKRRKMNGRDVAGKHERAPTHRRLVRELDEVVVDDGPLDYGEEPTVSTNFTKDPSQKETVQDPYRRKPVVYDEDVTEPSVEAPDPPHAGRMMPERGRKIWWPVIGT